MEDLTSADLLEYKQELEADLEATEDLSTWLTTKDALKAVEDAIRLYHPECETSV